jgi:hypothetical protein
MRDFDTWNTNTWNCYAKNLTKSTWSGSSTPHPLSQLRCFGWPTIRFWPNDHIKVAPELHGEKGQREMVMGIPPPLQIIDVFFYNLCTILIMFIMCYSRRHLYRRPPPTENIMYTTTGSGTDMSSSSILKPHSN